MAFMGYEEEKKRQGWKKDPITGEWQKADLGATTGTIEPFTTTGRIEPQPSPQQRPRPVSAMPGPPVPPQQPQQPQQRPAAAMPGPPDEQQLTRIESRLDELARGATGQTTQPATQPAAQMPPMPRQGAVSDADITYWTKRTRTDPTTQEGRNLIEAQYALDRYGIGALTPMQRQILEDNVRSRTAQHRNWRQGMPSDTPEYVEPERVTGAYERMRQRAAERPETPAAPTPSQARRKAALAKFYADRRSKRAAEKQTRATEAQSRRERVAGVRETARNAAKAVKDAGGSHAAQKKAYNAEIKKGMMPETPLTVQQRASLAKLKTLEAGAVKATQGIEKTQLEIQQLQTEMAEAASPAAKKTAELKRKKLEVELKTSQANLDKINRNKTKLEEGTVAWYMKHRGLTRPEAEKAVRVKLDLEPKATAPKAGKPSQLYSPSEAATLRVEATGMIEKVGKTDAPGWGTGDERTGAVMMWLYKRFAESYGYRNLSLSEQEQLDGIWDSTVAEDSDNKWDPQSEEVTTFRKQLRGGAEGSSEPQTGPAKPEAGPAPTTQPASEEGPPPEAAGKPPSELQAGMDALQRAVNAGQLTAQEVEEANEIISRDPSRMPEILRALGIKS